MFTYEVKIRLGDRIYCITVTPGDACDANKLVEAQYVGSTTVLQTRRL